MLTRRGLLLGSALTLTAGQAALAAPRHRRPHRVPPATATPAAPPVAPLVPSPAQTPIGPLDILARWALILDYNTGATLLDKKGEEQMTPSSLTKLMTVYIVFSQLAAGRLKLDQKLPVSKAAWEMGGSKMFVPLGGMVSVADLLRGVFVDSGNDACIVLAEGVAGSQAQFVLMMNETGKKLGLVNSHFLNVMGWPVPGHYMCCRDVATIARDIIRRFPQYYHFAGRKQFTFSNIKQNNRNLLVDNGMADGLKTGHTEAGGYGLCVSADRHGRRVIVVLNGMPSIRDRDQEGIRMLDWAFNNFEDVHFFAAGAEVDKAPVYLGVAREVPLVSAQDVLVTLPRGWRKDTKVSVQYNAPVAAPVHKGQMLGTLNLSGPGIKPQQMPLLAGADIARLPLPERGWEVVMHTIHNYI